VSWNPKVSVLIHLCLKPVGAGGASKDDGGDQTFGLEVFSLV
jgi:hypothetical protein